MATGPPGSIRLAASNVALGLIQEEVRGHSLTSIEKQLAARGCARVGWPEPSKILFPALSTLWEGSLENGMGCIVAMLFLLLWFMTSL